MLLLVTYFPRQMDGDNRYKAEGDKMEREQVRIDITERDMASTRAKLRRAKALRDALRQEVAGTSVDGKHVASKDERGDVDGMRAGKHVKRGARLAHGAGAAATGASKARRTRASMRAVATRAVPRQQVAPVAPHPVPHPPVKAHAHHSSERNAEMAAHRTSKVAADSTRKAADSTRKAADSNRKTPPENKEEKDQRGLPKALQEKEAERALATAVDAIGVPAEVEAEDRHVSLDEGGSPAREMELGVCAARRMPLQCLCLCTKNSMSATPPSLSPAVHRRRRAGARRREPGWSGGTVSTC